MASLHTCLFFLVVLRHSSAVPVPGYPEDILFEKYQGDMLVSHEEKQLVSGESDDPLAKRGATSKGIWTNGIIPYKFTDNPRRRYSYSEMKRIRSAMDEWENKTCIKFVPVTNERVRVVITNFGSSCFAIVGNPLQNRQLPGNKIVSFRLQLPRAFDCLKRATILHELGHVIGFWHEVSRPDRDNYVKIQHENIMNGKENQFKKYTNKINTFGIPYDYYSIMHYGPTAFSENGKDTIVPADGKNVILKENTAISPLDVQQAKLLYNC